MAVDPDSVEWFYLDRHGEEFGPFAAYKMRAWFSAGYFPIGEKLLVRLAEWRRHVPVHDLWGEGSAFVGPHRETGQRAPPQQQQAMGGAPHPAWGFMPPHMPPDPHGYHMHPFGGYGSPPPPGPGYWPAPGVPHFPHALHHPGVPAALGYGEMGRNARPPPPPQQQQHRARSRSPRRNGSATQRGAPSQGTGFKPHHTSVPKKTDLADKFSSNGPPTTGMLRNIPNKYDQKMLLDELHQAGFENTYNFFYLPMDLRNNANVGYAFINFVKPEDFERFSKGFQGHQFKQGGKRTAAVSPAVVQGFSANVRNLAKKKVTAGDFRPLVIKDGISMSLEDAAKHLKEEAASKVSSSNAEKSEENGAEAPKKEDSEVGEEAAKKEDSEVGEEAAKKEDENEKHETTPEAKEEEPVQVLPATASDDKVATEEPSSVPEAAPAPAEAVKGESADAEPVKAEAEAREPTGTS